MQRRPTFRNSSIARAQRGGGDFARHDSGGASHTHQGGAHGTSLWRHARSRQGHARFLRTAFVRRAACLGRMMPCRRSKTFRSPATSPCSMPTGQSNLVAAVHASIRQGCERASDASFANVRPQADFRYSNATAAISKANSIRRSHTSSSARALGRLRVDYARRCHPHAASTFQPIPRQSRGADHAPQSLCSMRGGGLVDVAL